ncbi:globin [Agaribacterium haliotis]|uniref:globin n=1 Tax=Agaribacterium haliotis TaxID=2013869 RepID=UPI00195A60EC|nr:globin [Agaribacterium haliotis]
MSPMHAMGRAPAYETLFDQSYERVRRNRVFDKDFFDTFYDKFLPSSPEVAQKFRNTDMAKQRQMLEKSFYHLLVFYASGDADDYMQRMVAKHGRHGVNIPDHLYDLWMDTLIATVKVFDPEYSDDVALAWRLVLAPGLTYMKYR